MATVIDQNPSTDDRRNWPELFNNAYEEFHPEAIRYVFRDFIGTLQFSKEDDIDKLIYSQLQAKYQQVNFDLLKDASIDYDNCLAILEEGSLCYDVYQDILENSHSKLQEILKIDGSAKISNCVASTGSITNQVIAEVKQIIATIHSVDITIFEKFLNQKIELFKEEFKRRNQDEI